MTTIFVRKTYKLMEQKKEFFDKTIAACEEMALMQISQ
jgi:hypothetical protein